MATGIKGIGIRGMNNVQQSDSHFIDQHGIVTPKVILNADVLFDNTVVKRDGQTKLIDLQDAHSLWAGSVMLCVDKGKLYRLEGSQKIELCAVEGPQSQMNYIEIGNLIYMSNQYWTGIYNLLTDEVRDWGIENPLVQPKATLTNGNLPPGRYSLCYTKVREDGLISGNGPILKIEFEGIEKGIELLNYSSEYLCWITDTDEGDFFQAKVESNKITGIYFNQPLLSLLCRPPQPMSVMEHTFGRIWGVVGKNLYYNQPPCYEWFKDANCFPFIEEPHTIAPVKECIFINSMHHTWVLIGTDPEKMVMQRIGNGAVPGSLSYGEVQQSGQEILTWRHKTQCPVWLSDKGFVAGTQNARLTNLTEEILNISLGQKAAALYRIINGEPQFIVSMPALGNGDAMLNAIFKEGEIFATGEISIPIERFIMASKKISSGAISIIKCNVIVTVEAESGTTDDLDTINGGQAGCLLILEPASGHTVTVKKNANIQIPLDFTLDEHSDKLFLICDAPGKWHQLSRSSGTR